MARTQSYTVTKTEKVRVSATNINDAALLANHAFNQTEPPNSVNGRIHGPVVVVNMNAESDG